MKPSSVCHELSNNSLILVLIISDETIPTSGKGEQYPTWLATQAKTKRTRFSRNQIATEQNRPLGNRKFSVKTENCNFYNEDQAPGNRQGSGLYLNWTLWVVLLGSHFWEIISLS